MNGSVLFVFNECLSVVLLDMFSKMLDCVLSVLFVDYLQCSKGSIFGLLETWR